MKLANCPKSVIYCDTKQALLLSCRWLCSSPVSISVSATLTHGKGNPPQKKRPGTLATNAGNDSGDTPFNYWHITDLLLKWRLTVGGHSDIKHADIWLWKITLTSDCGRSHWHLTVGGHNDVCVRSHWHLTVWGHNDVLTVKGHSDIWLWEVTVTSDCRRSHWRHLTVLYNL